MMGFNFLVRFMVGFISFILGVIVLIFFSLPHIKWLLIYESSVISDPIDAVVVLGGGRGERIKKAVSVLDRYNPSYLIMTGGPFFHTSRSKLMGEYAQRLNDDLPILLYEEASLSTYDHVRFLAPFFQRYHIQSVLIVTSSYHTARSYDVFTSYAKDNNQDLKIFIHGAEDGIDYSCWWKSHEMMELVFIEFVKRVYYKLFLT